MPPNPSASHQGRTEGQGSSPPSHPPTHPSYGPWGSSGGRRRRRIPPAVRVPGRWGQPSPARHLGTNGTSHPQTITSFQKQDGAQAVTKQLSSPAALPSSSGCRKAAINPSRCPAFCTVSSLPAPSSARDRLRSADITPPAPVPLPGFAFASLHSGLWGTSTEPLSTGSAALNPEGECKAGSASGLWLFSHFQLQKRWVSPGQRHAGSDLQELKSCFLPQEWKEG